MLQGQRGCWKLLVLPLPPWRPCRLWQGQARHAAATRWAYKHLPCKTFHVNTAVEWRSVLSG